MTTPLRRWVFWPVVLLTLLVIVGWVRGRYYLDKLFVNKDTYWIEFGSGDGVWVQSSPWVNDSPPVGVYQFGSYPRNNLFRILGGTRDTHHNFRVNDGWRGFVMVSEQYPDANGVPTRYRYFEVPYWFLAAVMAGPAAWAAWTAWHYLRSRRRPGHCAGCGYDLRASADRCPECGRPFSAHPDAPSATETCATGGAVADE
ncbi:MAG TPA: hypothetical protein VFB66_08200 [Tepidisphaeraceae bacterium]|nr:hypothetical protein [Tepidisphaeraceae bacterium]